MQRRKQKWSDTQASGSCASVRGHPLGAAKVQNADLVLLPLTLVVSVVTFASGRTNVLQGAVHLLLFLAYLVLLFQG